MTKKPKETKAMLRRRILELESQMAFTFVMALNGIKQATESRYMASGILLQLTAIGGKEIIPPTMIKDGFKPETIEAIAAEIQKSSDLTVAHNKPKS